MWLSGWQGQILLDPDQDSWFETEVAPEIVINVEGNFDAVLNVIKTISEQFGILGRNLVW